MLAVPVFPTIYWMLTLHCIIGLLAAMIADRKGFNLNRWLLWGLIGGTVALVTVLWKKGVSHEP